MKNTTWLIALALAGFVAALPARAEKAGPETPPAEKQGAISGELTHKDGGKITVKGEDGELKLMPQWRGGMPADGGGFDKDMLKRLEKFQVGDQVRVEWVFEEHYRIEKITRAGERSKRKHERADPAPKPES